MGKPKKLEGRKNFDEWKVEAKAYLATKGHWKCFDGTETDPDKKILAIQMLNLLLSSALYTYTEKCTTAKQAWDSICSAFEDTGIGRRVDLLKQLVGLQQSDFPSMEDYVHKMVLMATKVKKAGLEIGDDVVAALMLAGLPDEYRPMVMAIENSTPKLTTDFVQNRLLQEVSYSNKDSAETALYAKKRFNKKPKNFSQKSVKCYVCDKVGHFANKCPNRKNKDEKEKLLICSFMAQSSSSKDWYIDSGASAHMTMIGDSLVDVREPIQRKILVGNNSYLDVQQAGDIKMSIGTSSRQKHNVTVKDVLHVPNICANLMSVSKMAKHGNTLVFDKECCRIYDSTKSLIATAPLVNGLYKLNCSIDQTATAMMTIDKNIWHRRLGHTCDANLRKIRSAVIVKQTDKQSDFTLNSKRFSSSLKAATEDGTCLSVGYENDSSEDSESDENLSDTDDEDLRELHICTRNESGVGDSSESGVVLSEEIGGNSSEAAGCVDKSNTTVENSLPNDEFSEAVASVNSSYTSVNEADFDVALSEVSVVPCHIATELSESMISQPANTRDALSLHAMLAAAMKDGCEPKSFQEAKECEGNEEWKAAMRSEYESNMNMDVVSAFLQGELSDEIRLKKALYELKQSSQVWNAKLNDVLVSALNFKRSSIDQCIYFKHSRRKRRNKTKFTVQVNKRNGCRHIDEGSRSY